MTFRGRKALYSTFLLTETPHLGRYEILDTRYYTTNDGAHARSRTLAEKKHVERCKGAPVGNQASKQIAPGCSQSENDAI